MATQRTEPDAAAQLAQIRTHGYATWVRSPADVGVAAIRAAIDRVVGEHAPATLWAAETQPVSERAILTPTGFALPWLLREAPELEPLVLPAALRQAVADLLGPAPRLELLGAVVTDRSRPFFSWHTHIDGLEESERLRQRSWPRIGRLRRI